MKTDIKKAIFINKTNLAELILDKNLDFNWVDLTAKYLNDGYKIIQLTNLNYSDKEFLRISTQIRQLVSIFDSLLFISYRADIAKLVNADGLTLNKDSIDYSLAKRIVSDEILIGSFEDNFESNYDYLITDNLTYDTKIPTFSKLKSENNINFYRMEKYDFN